jgi:folate-dependent phosphoribosylglycinamide formyltransferase PurN
MPFKRIVLLAGKWDTTPLVYNFLQEHFGVEAVILEDGVPRNEFLKKRIRKLGWFEVAGQVMFQILVGKPLSILSKKRIGQIKRNYSLNDTAIPPDKVIAVPSVNSESSLHHLKQMQPDLVVVHGTRIISKKILQGVDAPFINIHAGITPQYRGSHGAYWALANGDAANCGVTVHLVDAGIDTGGVLAQATIPYTKQDNFITYPYLQLAEGLQLLKDVVQKMERGEKWEVKTGVSSALWHHPTLWGYLWKRATKGVK